MKQTLNSEMLRWAPQLMQDLTLDLVVANKLGTTIEHEVDNLENDKKDELILSNHISPKDRLDELVAFQGWMDYVRQVQRNPYIIRAQVITQNYICFVYLGDALFKSLKTILPPPLVTGRCCRFLLNNPIRAFRNAVAHSNWQYNSDFTGIEFWSRKGSASDEPLVHFEVSQDELSYWQGLSRCVGYSAYMALSKIPVNEVLKRDAAKNRRAP